MFFADDLKIYIEVKSTLDCILLQNSLFAMARWYDKNKLQLNIRKCKVMRYSKTKSPIAFNYKVDHQVLEVVQSHRDLDVLFDFKLKFNLHIDSKQLGFRKRFTNDLFKHFYTQKFAYNAGETYFIICVYIYSSYFECRLLR